MNEEYHMDKRDDDSTRVCVHRDKKSRIKFILADKNSFHIQVLDFNIYWKGKYDERIGKPTKERNSENILHGSYLHVHELSTRYGDFRDEQSTRVCAHMRPEGMWQMSLAKSPSAGSEMIGS